MEAQPLPDECKALLPDMSTCKWNKCLCTLLEDLDVGECHGLVGTTQTAQEPSIFKLYFIYFDHPLSASQSKDWLKCASFHFWHEKPKKRQMAK